MTHLCAYGDCDNTFVGKKGITVSRNDYTERFCCEVHAAAWLLKHSNRDNYSIADLDEVIAVATELLP